MLDITFKEDADVVCANIAMYNDQTQEITKCKIENSNLAVANEVFENEPKQVKSTILLGHWTASSSSTKIIKKELYDKYKFIGTKANDIPCIYPILATANKIIYYPDLYKYYRIVEKSLSRRDDEESYNSVVESIVLAFKLLDEIHAQEEKEILFFNNCLNYLLGSLANIPEIHLRENCIQNFYNKLIEYNKNIFIEMKNSIFYENFFKCNALPNEFYTYLIDGKPITFIEKIKEREKMMHEKNNPKVTIVIPVYNGEQYLKEAIDSALAQTYTNIEVLVVNDGSKDKTDEIAKSYGDKIKYIKKANGGVASALNVAIKEMSGEYFSWLSHDDLYLPTKIEKEINALSTLENKDTIIACNVDVVSYSLDLIRHNKIPDNAKRSMACYLAFDQSVGLNGCALLIPKKLFDKHGLFNEDLKVTQDYDMWFRFAAEEEFFVIDDNLVLSRQHDNQGSKTMKEVHYEVDNLHSRFISKIKVEDFLNFVDNDIDLCKKYYTQYLIAMNCKKSAIRTLVLYINILMSQGKEKEALDFINKEFFANTNLELNKTLLSNIQNSKPKLVFYNNVWIKGGIERVLSKLFDGLKNDYDIVFVSTNFDENVGYELPEAIKQIQIAPNLNQNICHVLLFICALEKADIFIGNQNLDEFFIPTYKLLKESGIKTIACNHYNYFLPFQLKWLSNMAKIRNYYYNFADAVTWTTTASQLCYSAINDNGYYLPNPNSFEAQPQKTTHGKNIICVARFNDLLKRLDLSLKCFKLVLEKVPDATLTVVGSYDLDLTFPDEKKTLKELLNELQIPEKSINFVGEVSNAIDYYKKADIFMLTSETEGFGMVLTEAATCGVPSVAFNITGLDDIIIDGKNGYLVNMFDIQAMADRISEFLLLDDSKKAEMSNTALELSHKFDLDKVIDMWKQIINSISKNESVENTLEPKVKKLMRQYEKELIVKLYDNNSSTAHSTMATPIPEPTEYAAIDKGSYLNQLKYYIRTYGLKKTIKKIICKIFRR